MRIFLALVAFVLLQGFGVVLAPASAQDDIDFSDIFSNTRFYEEHDLLRAEGDVGFIADAWFLPGPADSVRVLLGLSLSNSDLQFVRTTEGQWQASYGVTASLEPEAGGAPLQREWTKTVDVSSFDETLLTGETIVFQTELRLLPGSYDLVLTVRDRNGDDGSRVDGTLDVPALAGPQIALSEPVLLRLFRPGTADYIVNPSHYYATAPPQIDFLVEVSAATGGGPYRLQARLLPAGGDEEREGDQPPLPTWSDTLAIGGDGTARAFGTIENSGARFGEYALELQMLDSSGAVVATRETPLLIAGSTGWIADNWDDALSLIRYEATGDEMDILEEIEDPRQRVEAWNCFWAIRDPIPATSGNEALQEYFRKIQVANNTWKSALRPGYLSDRGRVFITLGPPDEVTQRPVPGDSNPFEVWTYHRYNFQILFVDRIGFNNYQLENVGTYQRELSLVERRKRQFLEERASSCPLLAPAFD